VLKLRDYLIKVAQKTENLEQRVEDMEKKLKELENRIRALESLPAKPSPTALPARKATSGYTEEEEFSDLAKELGLLEALGGPPPEPPPAPPIERETAETESKIEERAPSSFIATLKTGEEVKEEELKKEKDELVKVLEELELI